MTVREKADRLNISVHTLKNWQNRNESETLGVENLVSRANKLSSSRQILPKELVQKAENVPLIGNISKFLDSLPLSLEGKFFYFMISFLHFKGVLNYSNTKPESCPPLISLEDIINGLNAETSLLEELTLRFKDLGTKDRITALTPLIKFEKLLKKSLNKEYDLPGLIYQYLREEGGRSHRGAWFTPLSVINSMLRPYSKKKESLFDPCCGSGLFLCRFAEMKKTARGVSGMDSDPMSVFISRINLFLRFPESFSFNSVIQADSLQIGSWHLDENCLIATNPPWGAHLKPSVKKYLKKRYPEIKSGETAALFVRRAVEELNKGGAASFLLPESLCYVKAHQDIRRYLLTHAPPVRIIPRGPLFHSVYSEVFSCDILKGGQHRKLKVGLKDSHPLERYRKNPDFLFNIHCSEKENALMSKIETGPSRKLPKNCLWLLGVVTGDNKRFLTDKASETCLPILTGKEVHPFHAAEARYYLRLDRGPLQQSRKQEEYKDAKLIYRFIGYTPVFSIDREGLITLNSANSLVLPKPGTAEKSDWDIELEELAFWYNSSLFKFLWLKQFNSVKMLKRHLEKLSIPLWDKDEKSRIRSVVKSAEKGQDISLFMNEMLFKHYDLNEEERDLVLKQN